MANKRGPSDARSSAARSTAAKVAKVAKPGDKGKGATPKGATNRAKGPPPSKRVTPKGTGRYTPPVPKAQKVSPIYVPIIMFACRAAGMLMIILNSVSVLPKSPHNGWLRGGLGLITVGFITATRYH